MQRFGDILLAKHILDRTAALLAAAPSLVVSLAACHGPMLPSGAEEFTPPAVYRRWWAWTATCSGRAADFSSVKWYSVDGSAVSVDGQFVSAYWSRQGNTIVVAAPYRDYGLAVRHEMLHALLRSSEHRRAYFLDSCAGLVECSQPCAQSAERWTSPIDMVTVGPDSLMLEVSAYVRTEVDAQKFVEVQVLARNPSSKPVLILVPGDSPTPPTFAYDLRGPEGGISSSTPGADSSMLVFAPRETKKWIYEFRVETLLTQYTIPAGQYLVRAGYGKRWSAWQTLQVDRE